MIPGLAVHRLRHRATCSSSRRARPTCREQLLGRQQQPEAPSIVGLDVLWSTPLDEAHHWDFEYGVGVGLGVVFGTLNNDWVYQTNRTATSRRPTAALRECQPGTRCRERTGAAGRSDLHPGGHQNSQHDKVGGYAEKNWFNGGSMPVIFPHIALPQLGLRYKPIKQFEARLGLGFSLTGLLVRPQRRLRPREARAGVPEPAPKAKPKRDSSMPSLQGTLLTPTAG